jgi:hypothetical protein
MLNTMIVLAFPGVENASNSPAISAEMTKIFFAKVAVLAQTVERLVKPAVNEFLLWKIGFNEDACGVTVRGVVEICTRHRTPLSVSLLSGGEIPQRSFISDSACTFSIQPQCSDEEIVDYARQLISKMGLTPA